MTKCLNSAGVEMPRFYVATYGDLGLEIEFYFDPLRYGRDIRKAEREHANGKAGISPDLAIRLERAGVSTARFWMNLQLNYELSKAEARDQPEVRPLQSAAA